MSVINIIVSYLLLFIIRANSIVWIRVDNQELSEYILLELFISNNFNSSLKKNVDTHNKNIKNIDNNNKHIIMRHKRILRKIHVYNVEFFNVQKGSRLN
jgi:hypothetical protein